MLRIIPARAGFTAAATWEWITGRDHPRSRGVYPIEDRDAIARFGSSPLARGLPETAPRSCPRIRIIPARAGFTDAGVLRLLPLFGSSPLARGLPDGTPVGIPGEGIIPARAGFTPAAPRRRTQCGDHPRSRGVYGACSGTRTEPSGSSPLARGLPTMRPHTGREIRIIPARAGFTTPLSDCSAGFSDHPRSRGVYQRAGRGRGQPLGSSPLARGLQGTEK